MSLRIGPYLVHLDALLARLVFLWRVHVVIVLLVIGIVMFGPTLVRWGQEALTPEGKLTVIAEGADTVEVDHRPWDGRIKIGAHRVMAVWQDSVSWRDIVLAQDTPVTITLTPGWSDFDVQRVALPQRAEVEFALMHPDGEITTVVRDDRNDPNGRRRQYAISSDRVRVVPSADAFDGRYDRSRDGRTIVSVIPRSKDSGEVVLAVENPEGSFRASYDGGDVRFVVAEPIRQSALIFESDRETNATRITWLTYRGRTLFIGAIDGEPTMVRWMPDYRAAVLIVKPSLRSDIASLFVLDMSGFFAQSSDSEFVPTLLAGGEQIIVPASALSPPMLVGDDRVMWASATNEGADIWSLSLRKMLVSKDMSFPCAVRAFQTTETGMTWVCAQSDSWEVLETDHPDGQPTGVAMGAPLFGDATGMEIRRDQGVWVGIAVDGAMVMQWKRS